MPTDLLFQICDHLDIGSHARLRMACHWLHTELEQTVGMKSLCMYFKVPAVSRYTAWTFVLVHGSINCMIWILDRVPAETVIMYTSCIVLKGHTDTLRKLWKAGYQFDIPSVREVAVISGRVATVRTLHELGVQFDCFTMSLAVSWSRLEVVRYLLSIKVAHDDMSIQLACHVIQSNMNNVYMVEILYLLHMNPPTRRIHPIHAHLYRREYAYLGLEEPI